MTNKTNLEQDLENEINDIIDYEEDISENFEPKLFRDDLGGFLGVDFQHDYGSMNSDEY
jgi:hypothetical protein